MLQKLWFLQVSGIPAAWVHLLQSVLGSVMIFPLPKVQAGQQKTPCLAVLLHLGHLAKDVLHLPEYPQELQQHL